MLLFSIATPLGIGIAWAVTELAEAEESPWSAALTAVGAGTFLFVATIECAAPPLRPCPSRARSVHPSFAAAAPSMMPLDDACAQSDPCGAALRR